MKIDYFTFGPFGENTFVISDDSKECIILDPGCSSVSEEQALVQYIEKEGLKPVKIVLTHAHIDHIMGCQFVSEKYQLAIYAHPRASEMIEASVMIAQMYGLPYKPSPAPNYFINEGDELAFGSTRFQLLHCPGHSPDSIVFYNEVEKACVAGDVLFNGSIGRTDLPGGNHEQLLNSILQKLFVQLSDEYVVYCGHGPVTTIGEENFSHPFVGENA